MKTRIGIAKLSQTGSRAGPETSEGPEIMEEGLRPLLEEMNFAVEESEVAELTPEEKRQYGTWNLLGLASRHLAETVASQRRRGLFTLGLLANCNGLMGMLAGLQRSGPNGRPLRVGLLWIDAHADYNTPETTLSGMLGGMPVAVSTGLCLHRLRRQCGLDPALPSRYVTMAAVRDVDPLERELLDRSEIQQITTDQIRRLSPAIDLEMERLAEITDLTYVHVDLDALDTREVPGHGLPVPDGPTSSELAAALCNAFEHPEAAAFGVASYPVGRDPDGVSLRAVQRLVEGVIQGLRNREG